jgi:tetratricopeptide (TPR) repeat protein
MMQEHLPDRVIGPAQAALDYYKKNGYFKLAANASLLLVRAERDKGQYQQALQSGNAFLDLATKSGSHLLMRQAEEVVGTVFFAMQQYPDALVHFQNAKSLADTASDKAYGAVNLAETLSRLGRFAESDATLQFEPVNDTLTILAAKTHTESLLSRGRYQEALVLAQQIPDRYPKMTSGDQLDFERDRAIAESHLGMKRQALNDLSDLESRQETGKTGKESARNLTIAEISLASGLPQQAHDAAAKAAAGFASTGQLDSELHSVCLAAAAAKRLKNAPEYITYSTKAVDIVSQIQHTWSPQVSQTYLSRPDIQLLLRAVPVVARSDRSSS